MKDKRAVEILQKLIQIPSENPGGTERAVACYIKDFLAECAYESKLYEYVEDRTNVVCHIRSTNSRKKILLSPHIDTVPAGQGWKHDPFSGEIVGSKLYGRGAADCKIHVAAAMEVIRQLSEGEFTLDNLDIIFAATADEETGSHHGFIPLVKELPFCDYSLILDGDDFTIGNSQKGLLHIKIDISGHKAHGAYLELGDNAVLKSMKAFQELQSWIKDYNKKNKGADITVNLGKIEGGDKVNMVPDTCMMELDIRFLPPMCLKELIKNVKATVKNIDKRAKFTILHQQKASFCDKKVLLVKILKETLKQHKKEIKYKLFKGATVLSFVQPKSEAVILGFGDAGVFHMTNEYVKVKNVKEGVALLRDLLINLDKHI